MTKQTKTLKLMLGLLIMIPIALFILAIVQTFIINSKQSQLNSLKTELIEAKEEKDELEKVEEYKGSAQFDEDYYKHETGYGNEGDVIIEIN